jgi:hypothetical protein
MGLTWKDLTNCSSKPSANNSGILASKLVNDLKPHPSWLRHNVSVSSMELNQQSESDCSRFNPILITRDMFVIEGYARLELAKHSGQVQIDCLECDLSEADALRLLLARHQRFQFLNAFIRICMALDLEPELQRAALFNQSTGGKNKDSSKLTEAERIDVRSEIARIACTCSGNVSKVKQLLHLADPQVLQALHDGELHIDRAWQWKNLSPAQQRIELEFWKYGRQINRKVELLLSRHIKKTPLSPQDPHALISRLSAFKVDSAMTIHTLIVDEPGLFICVSREMLEQLPVPQIEL